MFAGITKTILILLLLLGQGSALAHELDQDAHQANDSCKVCLLHSALDHSQVSADLVIWLPASSAEDSIPPALSLTARLNRHFQARAPPSATPV